MFPQERRYGVIFVLESNLSLCFFRLCQFQPNLYSLTIHSAYKRLHANHFHFLSKRMATARRRSRISATTLPPQLVSPPI